MEKVNVNAELVINILTEQNAALSKENAILKAQLIELKQTKESE
ncbi:MAG: hypothetical protein K0S34_85 [Bacillales bacterium]|nr:hypothetical protein [Bacillales bacterium]